MAAGRAAPPRLALLAALLLPAVAVHAGGPLLVASNGSPVVWSTAAPIPYRTDGGPLSATVTEAQARARVDAMFDVWQNVGSANIAYTRAGAINDTAGFTDGDVSTAAEFNAVEADCIAGFQNPIVYDEEGAIFIGLGVDETSVIGFAGPCALNAGLTQWVSGRAVMNGLFQDGQPAPVQDLSLSGFNAAFIHEFGHFSGLDHSQVNVECIGFCGADDLAGLPTMFPFLTDDSQVALSIDDIAWISKLYPQAGAGGFALTHGTVTGTVFFSDGESHAQFVNVVARQVDNGGTPADEGRTRASSSVSGYRFRIFHGNPIVGGGDAFGSQTPALIGQYEIALPPGNYMIEVESVNPSFTGGSSVGGPIQILMPGTAPAAIGPINVVVGTTSSGNDVMLIGSDPRFDQFEGP